MQPLGRARQAAVVGHDPELAEVVAVELPHAFFTKANVKIQSIRFL